MPAESTFLTVASTRPGLPGSILVIALSCCFCLPASAEERFARGGYAGIGGMGGGFKGIGGMGGGFKGIGGMGGGFKGIGGMGGGFKGTGGAGGYRGIGDVNVQQGTYRGQYGQTYDIKGRYGGTREENSSFGQWGSGSAFASSNSGGGCQQYGSALGAVGMINAERRILGRYGFSRPASQNFSGMQVEQHPGPGYYGGHGFMDYAPRR